MPMLNRNHVASPIASNRTVKWDEAQAAFVYSSFVEGAWQNVPVTTPLALDVFRTQHGFETWGETAGKRHRSTVMASVTAPIPHAPTDKSTPIYALPVYSREIGGEREMILKGKVATAAFCDLFELLENDLTNEAPQVPVVTVRVEDSDYGVKPSFEINQIVDRPRDWPAPIVNFAA